MWVLLNEDHHTIKGNLFLVLSCVYIISISISLFNFDHFLIMAAFVSRSLYGLAAIAAGSPKTCTSSQTSCQNTTAVADLCCFNAPGGQMLQTQFWDTSPATGIWLYIVLKPSLWLTWSGPANHWTLHGLWPDHCDGTYDANCDSSRNYGSISTILNSFGKTDLLSYMNTYWLDENGDNDSFWEHEWEKHGTCISTLRPTCCQYSWAAFMEPAVVLIQGRHADTSYTSKQEVVDYFQRSVDLFKTLDSYAVGRLASYIQA